MVFTRSSGAPLLGFITSLRTLFKQLNIPDLSRNTRQDLEKTFVGD
jgi:hypothetical protein